MVYATRAAHVYEQNGSILLADGRGLQSDYGAAGTACGTHAANSAVSQVTAMQLPRIQASRTLEMENQIIRDETARIQAEIEYRELLIRQQQSAIARAQAQTHTPNAATRYHDVHSATASHYVPQSQHRSYAQPSVNYEHYTQQPVYGSSPQSHQSQQVPVQAQAYTSAPQAIHQTVVHQVVQPPIVSQMGPEHRPLYEVKPVRGACYPRTSIGTGHPTGPLGQVMEIHHRGENVNLDPLLPNTYPPSDFVPVPQERDNYHRTSVYAASGLPMDMAGYASPRGWIERIKHQRPGF